MGIFKHYISKLILTHQKLKRLSLGCEIQQQEYGLDEMLSGRESLKWKCHTTLTVDDIV